MDELLQIFQALRTVDANGVSCPVDWVPGQQVLVASPATMDDAAKRMEGSTGMEVKSWYLAKRDLAKRDLAIAAK